MGFLRVLRPLGQRITVADMHSPPNRVLFVAAQLTAGFEKAYHDFALPHSGMTIQIPKGLANFGWPWPLNSASSDGNEALSELFRVFGYKQASTEDKSLLILEVFSRVLAHCPHLKSLAGRSHFMEAFRAFMPMLTVFGTPANPLFEDWVALDSAIEPSS